MLCASIIFGTHNSFAQSLRSKRFLKRIKEVSNAELVELSEFDLKIGLVVATNEAKAVVKVRNYQLLPQWTQLYYACDASMNPVAILEPSDVKNKSCALFNLKSGTVAIGDIVFLKQIPKGRG